MNRICLNEQIADHLGYFQNTSGEVLCRQLDDCVDTLLSKSVTIDLDSEEFLHLLTTLNWAKRIVRDLLQTTMMMTTKNNPSTVSGAYLDALSASFKPASDLPQTTH